MARKRQLSDPFGGFEKNEEKKTVITEEVKYNPITTNEINNELHTPKTEQENVTSNSNIDDVIKDVTLNVIQDVTQQHSIVSVAQIKDDLLSMYDEKIKKEKVEDTHIRTTFLFRKDLSKRLEKLAKNKRGFKTLFMNKAI
jgi:hypothetical protein